MNIKKIVPILILAAGLAHPQVIRCDEARLLFWQNKVLEAEVCLAKSNSIYFIVDAASGRILFKAKGVVLREWKISGLHGLPPAWPIQSTTLVRKEAQSTPKRKLIDPKNPKTAEEIGSYEPDALESKDMPSEYVLTFENEIRIHVTSGSEKLFSFLTHWKTSLEGAIYEQARNLWWAAFKPQARMLRIKIEDPKEARMLCWSLLDGMKGLIVLNFD